MCLSDVSDYLKLTVRISLINHYSSILRAANKKTMLLQKNYFYNRLVLILDIFSWSNFLKKISCFTTKLSYKTTSISQKKFSRFISKLSSSNICFKRILIQFGKNFHQSSSNIIIHSHIIWSKNINIICHRAYFKVKDAIKLIYLFWFFL